MFPNKIKVKAKKLFNLCLKRNVKLIFAESCTGGLLSALMTSFPNSSKIFIQSFVTYSNTSKNKLLGVKKQTLQKYGAVSKEVAKEMLNKLGRENKSSIVLSITGIAGPSGKTKTKAIGLVFIGIKGKKGTFVNKFNFKGNREKIRLLSVEKAIDLIQSII